MGKSPNERPSCFVCDGALTATASHRNFEHVGSFSRTWICDSCGAEYSESVEVEEASATDEGVTDATAKEPDDDQPETETSDLISRPEFQTFDSEWRSSDKYGMSDSDSDLSAFEKKQKKEAERKQRVLNNAKEMPVDWYAPFGTVLNQSDQFVVAQTLYKNRFVLLDIQSGEMIKEVELIRDQKETSTDDRTEWDSKKIPDDVVLHPSGIFELDTRPGWNPAVGIHWCVGPNALFTFDARGVSRYPGSDGGSTWTISAPTDEASEDQRYCAFLNGVLFVVTHDIVCAIQASTGEVSWRYELSGGNSDDLQLLLHPDNLYLSDGPKLVSLDVDTGDENWTRDIGDAHRDQTVMQFGGIEGDVLLTVEESDTEYVCGYDVASGEQLWAFQDRRGLSILQSHDGAVYIDGRDGVVLCLNAATGVLRWQHRLRKLVMENAKSRARPERMGVNSFRVTEEGIITSSWSGTVYLLDSETGNKEWELFPENSGSGPKAACRVVGDAVVRIKDTDVEAFDLSSGEERWSFETNEMIPTDTSWGEPVVADDCLYFTDHDGTLYEVGAEANGLKRLYHSEDDERQSFAVDSEHVYIASLDPSADIPAYKKAQEATKEPTDSERSTSSLLNLHALLR